MIDIKKIHPGINYFDKLSAYSGNGYINIANTSLQPDAKIISALAKSFKSGLNLYTGLDGYLPLRQIITSLIEKNYTYSFNPETEITITAGASQAIAIAISAFIKEGDEAIIFEPSYYTYGSLVQANGGRPLYIRLKQPDFHIDWDEVQKGINSRTKLILINSPHNPSGSILSAHDMERLSRIVNGTNIIVVSDESFENIIFDNYEHQSVARFPKLAERSLIISSFGKSLHTEGWKLGYCAAPAKISADFRKFHHFMSFSVNAPMQTAIYDILSQPELIQNISAQLQAKRDLLLNGLKKSRFRITPSHGTYYQLLNYCEISNVKDMEFAQELLDKHKLVVFPLSYFYHDLADLKFIRICFAQPDDLLKKAIEILNLQSS